jgi:hypothetical protein
MEWGWKMVGLRRWIEMLELLGLVRGWKFRGGMRLVLLRVVIGLGVFWCWVLRGGREQRRSMGTKLRGGVEVGVGVGVGGVEWLGGGDEWGMLEVVVVLRGGR